MTTAPRKLMSALATLGNLNGPSDVSRSNVVTLFSDLRQAIEALRMRKNGKVSELRTVCDWLQHNELNRSSHFHTLRRISAELDKHKGNKKMDEVTRGLVNGMLSPNGILAGINALIETCNLPAVEINSKALQEVFRTVMVELSEKPLSAYDASVDRLTYEEAKKKIGVDFDAIATEVKICEEEIKEILTAVINIRIVVPNGDYISISVPVHGLYRN